MECVPQTRSGAEFGMENNNGKGNIPLGEFLKVLLGPPRERLRSAPLLKSQRKVGLCPIMKDSCTCRLPVCLLVSTSSPYY